MSETLHAPLPTPAGYPETSVGSGLQTVQIHPDLCVVEANRQLGNTDPRFTSAKDVLANRLSVAKKAGVERLVVILPCNADLFSDLDRGTSVVSEPGYETWPEELRNKQFTYDPDNPPYMADLPGDGLVTTEKNVGLMLNVADCAPLVLYDPARQVLGLAHIGRRGADQDLGPKVLEHLQRYYGADPARIVAYFSPSIAPESYVFPEVSGALAEERWESHVHKTDDGYQIDVVGYAAQRLVEHGVQLANITQSPVDTRTDPNFYSYVQHRLNGTPDGRHSFLIAMKPDLT